MSEYDEDYFERGIATGKSCYENYRWIPELTIPMAMTIIDLLKIERGATVLDFGCAKGFLVKALRMLYRDAWGVDCSDYAICKVDPEVKAFCGPIHSLMRHDGFEYLIAKDVLEHIEKEKIHDWLSVLREKGKKMLAIIPLGESGKYRVPAYEKDITHQIREDETWWLETFAKAGWKVAWHDFRVPGIKDNWAMFDKGNGFYVLIR
jgi:cyclopropane fatty-acyl-phospholipid synthase-like methyltransferase